MSSGAATEYSSDAVRAHRGSQTPLDVALTFDDGPTEHTARLLDTLARHHAVATFFVLGEKIGVREGRIAVRRMVLEGHQIGNHSWSHAGPSVSHEEYARELARTDAALVELGAPAPIAHRLPFGLQRGDFAGGGRVSVLDALGRNSVGWSADPEDWRLGKDWPMDGSVPERIVTAVQSQLATHPPAPAIVLLHDQEATVECLGFLLTRLISSGSRLRRLDQLPPDCEFRAHGRCGYKTPQRAASPDESSLP